MNKRSFVILLSCILFVLVTISSGVASASYHDDICRGDGDGPNAPTGSVYIWSDCNGDRTASGTNDDNPDNDRISYDGWHRYESDVKRSSEDYNGGIVREPEQYLNGGRLAASTVITRQAHELLSTEGNGYDEPEDLPEDLRDALGNKDSIQNQDEDSAVAQYDRLAGGSSASFGRVDDHSFPNVPIADINSWNSQNSFFGWGYDRNSRSESNEFILPDYYHERIVANESEQSKEDAQHGFYDRPRNTVVTAKGESREWDAVQDVYLIPYSNDPSTWVHLHRYDSIDGDPELESFEDQNETRLYDRSYRVAGDRGTFRLLLTEPLTPNESYDEWRYPQGKPADDGDIRYRYSGENVTYDDFELVIENETSPGPCETGCNVTEYVDFSYRQNVGRLSVDWDFEDIKLNGERQPELIEDLGGERVKFTVKADVNVTYNKVEQTADRFCAERADEDDVPDDDDDGGGGGGDFGEELGDGQETSGGDGGSDEGSDFGEELGEGQETSGGDSEGGGSGGGSGGTIVRDVSSQHAYLADSVNSDLEVGDCIRYEVDWESSGSTVDAIDESSEISTSRQYVLTDSAGEFRNVSEDAGGVGEVISGGNIRGEDIETDPLRLVKAEFPNKYAYYVSRDAENFEGEPIPWSKITASDGENSFSVQSQWMHFGARDKRWDQMRSNKEPLDYTAYDPAVVANDGETVESRAYVSRTRPLNIHTYPAYKVYNRRATNGATITDPEYPRLNTEREIPSPGLIGHTTCTRNNPDKFQQWTQPNNIQGNYNYHEPCWWHFQAAGQGPEDIPVKYFELSQSVYAEDGDWRQQDNFRNRFTGEAYNDFIFSQKLKENLSKETFRNIYNGKYQYMNQVVFQTQTNTNAVRVHDIVGMEETVKVDRTVKVDKSRVTVEAEEKCLLDSGGNQTCYENPIQSPAVDGPYRIRITVEKYYPEDNEWRPYSTEDGPGGVIIRNRYISSNSLMKNTDENGETTAIVSQPDDGPIIDVYFKPEHWRFAEDPLAPKQIQRGVEESGNWIDSLVALFGLVWLASVGIEKATANFGDRRVDFMGWVFGDVLPGWSVGLMVFGLVWLVVTAPSFWTSIIGLAVIIGFTSKV